MFTRTFRYAVLCFWLSLFSRETGGVYGSSPAVDVLTTDLYREGCSAQEEDYTRFYNETRENLEFGDFGVKYPDLQDGKVTHTWRWTPSQRETKELYLYFKGLYAHPLSQDYFTWCIKLFSTKHNISGCIDTNGTFSVTPAMAALGLMDVFSLPPGSAGAVVLHRDRSSLYTLLHNAMLIAVADVPFLNNTVVKYHHLLIFGSAHLSISFPTDHEFLTQDETKTLTCNVIGPVAVLLRWEYNGVPVDKCDRLLNPDPCDDRVHYTVEVTSHEELLDCGYNQEFDAGYIKSKLSLVVNSSSPEDIGNYTCLAESTDFPPRLLLANVLPVNIAFHNQSDSVVILPERQDATVTCQVTAPSDARIRWQRASLLVDSLQEEESGVGRDELCSRESVPRALFLLSSLQLQGSLNFSVFTAELIICGANHSDAGEYSCVVELPDETAELNFNIIVEYAVQYSAPLNSVGLALTVIFPLCVVALAVLIVSVAVWITRNKRQQQQLKRRPSKVPLTRFNSGSFKSSGLGSPLTPSPAVAAAAMWCSFLAAPENALKFPRSQLHLEMEIGRGRFGQVWKAKAVGIVPSDPGRNVVAVKTINSISQTENEHLCSEIAIMSRIEPHIGICNLLAYCSPAGLPPCLIMEYACHGNLKDFLRKCRNNAINSERAVKITQDSPARSSTGGLHYAYYNDAQSVEEAQNQSGQRNVLAVTNPLYDHLYTPMPAAPHTEYDHLTSREESAAVECPADDISEELVCRFARQISDGMEHLEKEGVVHRDLAARNILIAEGFLLKISDFGMARQLVPDDPSLEGEYQRLATAEVIPAKWTAPEVLEQMNYSYKSDVWSYGIVIWEIASYGCDPFSEFTIGVSLEPFIQHLKGGAHPSQPEGLSESIYEVLCRCWQVDPKRRPSAAMVGLMLRQAEERLTLHRAVQGATDTVMENAAAAAAAAIGSTTA